MFGRNQGRTLKTSRASSTQGARTACFVPTSDRNAGKVSEAQGFRGAPPTETWRKCRRSRTFEGYLRRKRGKSVGGQQEKEGTSDSFVVFLSEVTLCCCQPVSCRRNADRMSTEMRAQKANRQRQAANGLDLHPDVVRAEALECCAVQFFAVVWMGDADELLGAFLEGFAVEVHCSVLCHDIVHVRP